MEIPEILQVMERSTGPLARAAVQAAVERREEITPQLLRILEETTDHAEERDAEGGYMAHLYAMFLLAQFREPRAYPLVVRFASLPDQLLDSLCGDFITENLGSVLASVCDGDLQGIQSLIENEDAAEYARGAALCSLLTLVASGQKSRDEIVAYFAELFRGRLRRTGSHVWDQLVSCACDLYPAELFDEIQRAFEDELVDSGYIGLDSIRSDLALGQQRVLARLANDPHRRLVDSSIAAMERWTCLENDGEASIRPPHGAGAFIPTGQIIREGPKTGRNDPCPCGSGRKYKKCCGG